jgi:hypothetical protein
MPSAKLTGSVLAVYIALLISTSCIKATSILGEAEEGVAGESEKEVSPSLIIDLLRGDRVDGSYVSQELGCGIIFNSTRDSLVVTTLNGSRLVSAEERVGPVRLVTLGNREFIQHREIIDPSDAESGTVLDYAIPKYHGSFAGSRDHGKFAHLLGKLKKLDRSVHAKVLQKSMQRILTEPEIQLLHDAAVAMGQRGITGRGYPSALPLYMTAMRLSSNPSTITTVATDNNFPQSDTNDDDEKPEHFFTRMKRSSQTCLAKCPPCKNKKCLGLCGRGCSCWRWACGNCCYHIGCYYHDLCCRSRPYSLACWVPLDFDCDKKFICKDPF